MHLRVQETNSLLVAPRASAPRACRASFFRRPSSTSRQTPFPRSSACFPPPCAPPARRVPRAPSRAPRASRPGARRTPRATAGTAAARRTRALARAWRQRARAPGASLRSSGVTWFATSSACSARSSSKSMDASFSRRASRVASARAFRASNLVSRAKGDASVVSQRFPRARWIREDRVETFGTRGTEPRGRHARAPLFELVLRDHLVGVVLPLRVQVADVTRLVQSSAAGRNWTRLSAFAREGSRSRRARF